MRAFRIPVVTALALLSTGLNALGECEKSASCESRYLEELIVTANRSENTLLFSPYASSLVTAEDLKWYKSDSVAELLRDIPGVNIVDSGQAGMKRIRIRGEESYRVAVLIDGQEVSDHRGEGVPLTLDPSIIDHVEVIKGAGSVLYGPKALAGVINFVTKKGGDKPIQATASSAWNSESETQQYSFSGFGSVNGFDYRLSYCDSDSNERNTPTGEIENTTSAHDSLSLYLGKHFSSHELAFTWDDHNAYSDVFVEEEVRTSFPFTDFALEIPQRDREKTGVFYNWDKPTALIERIEFNAYHQVSDREFNSHRATVFATTTDTFSKSELETDGALLQINLNPGRSLFLVTGMQYNKDRVEQDRTQESSVAPPSFVQDVASQETRALFSQAEWDINDAITLTAGARYYEVDADLDSTTRAGLDTEPNDDYQTITTLATTFELAKNSVLRVGFSEGYIYPSLLQTSIGAVSREFVNPNPSLMPESSNTWEMGWRFSGESAQIDIGGFYTEAKNYIDHVACEVTDNCLGGTADRIYINIGKANTFGIESSLSFDINTRTSAYSSLAWLRRENRFEAFSSYDSGLPAISGSAGIKVKNQLSSYLTHWYDMYLQGESGVDEVDESMDRDHNGGWVTLNLSMGFEIGNRQQYRLIMDAKNLLDKLYSTSYENLPAEGRGIYARFVVNLDDI